MLNADKYNFNLMQGDIFNYIGKVDAICVTTNGTIKSNGELVMGAGVAKEFYDRYNDNFYISKILAQKLYRGPKLPQLHVVESKDNICYKCIDADNNAGTYVISFPTKNHFQDKGDIELIKQSAKRILWIANHYNLNSIIISSPGTGCGKLSKEEVYNELNKILDKRFYIITK